MAGLFLYRFDRVNPLTELTLNQLRLRTSLKWRTYPEDVLPLWVAEMDVALAPPVQAALRAAIDLGDTGYPAGAGYAEAFCRFAGERWDWTDIGPDRIEVVPDVMTGIVEALRLITRPGDPVIIASPVYGPFFAFVTNADRRVLDAALGSDGRLDFVALEEAFRTARAGSDRPVFLMSNPHNPTGAVHTREELGQVALLAARHGVRVISDEIHAPLVLSGARFTPYLSVPGSENAFALTSASKSWNLAGLKAALLIAGTASLDDLARLPEVVGHGASHFGVLAHTAALKRGGSWLDGLLAGLEKNRGLLHALVAAHLPGCSLLHPEGTYLAWLDCSVLGESGQGRQKDGVARPHPGGPADFFLDSARVALSPGPDFGNGGAGHVRINYATNPEILTEAIERMGEAVRRRQNGSN